MSQRKMTTYYQVHQTNSSPETWITETPVWKSGVTLSNKCKLVPEVLRCGSNVCGCRRHRWICISVKHHFCQRGVGVNWRWTEEEADSPLSLSAVAGHHRTRTAARMEIRHGRQVKDGDKDEGGRSGNAGAKRREKKGAKWSMWGEKHLFAFFFLLLSRLNTSESGWLQFTGSTSPHTVEDIRGLPK